MRLPVHIWIREENASPHEIAGYLIELARRLDERPQKMRLFVESSVPVYLDFDSKDGNPVVMVGDSTYKFDIRHRWLAEHPVPLKFEKHRVVLLIDPIDGNRFRVKTGRNLLISSWAYAFFSLLAVVMVMTFHPAAITITIIMAVLLSVCSGGRKMKI